MMTGWQLLMSASVDPDDIECVCVRVGSEFGQVPVADAEHWLSQMHFFTSYEDEGWRGNPTLTAAEEVNDFQVWTPLRIYRTITVGGIIVLEIIPRTPSHWMRVTSRPERALSEIETGREWKYGEPT